MSSVWLENVLTKQPARWLPSGYSDYGSLLTAAVENVVKQSGLSVESCSRRRRTLPLTSSNGSGERIIRWKSIIWCSASFR